MENVTNIDVARLAQLIVNTQLDAYSDDGRIWERSKDALDLVMRMAPDEVCKDAQELARQMWREQYVKNPD